MELALIIVVAVFAVSAASAGLLIFGPVLPDPLEDALHWALIPIGLVFILGLVLYMWIFGIEEEDLWAW